MCSQEKMSKDYLLKNLRSIILRDMKRGLMVQCGHPRFKHQLCHLVLNSLGRVTWLFACFSICKMVMILMPPPGVVVRNKWVNMLKALSTVCFLLVHSYPLLLWAFLVGSAPEVDVHHLGDLPGVTYSTFVPPPYPIFCFFLSWQACERKTPT